MYVLGEIKDSTMMRVLIIVTIDDMALIVENFILVLVYYIYVVSFVLLGDVYTNTRVVFLKLVLCKSERWGFFQ